MVDHLSDEDIAPILNFIDQVLTDPIQCLLRTFSAPLNDETTMTLILDRSRTVVSLSTWSHLLKIKLYPRIQIQHVLYQRRISVKENLDSFGTLKFKRREKHLRKYFADSLMIQLQPYQHESEDFWQRVCDVISSHLLSTDEGES